MKNKKNKLEKLLKNELVCFKEILYKTQQVSSSDDLQSIESISYLLNHRDKQIELIKKLESDRKSLNALNDDVKNAQLIESLKKEIKNVALKLVQIDANMLDLIAMRKEEIIKGLCLHADNSSIDRSNSQSGRHIIDITLD